MFYISKPINKSTNTCKYCGYTLKGRTNIIKCDSCTFYVEYADTSSNIIYWSKTIKIDNISYKIMSNFDFTKLCQFGGGVGNCLIRHIDFL